jgi:AcrR family transcriptional regulator
MKLKKAALFHFANSGYDGTSLSAIAGEVGIKKQSIYVHFAKKDEFVTIFDEVHTTEKNYILNYFTKEHSSNL